MNTNATRRLISVYNSQATPELFLSGMFVSPAQNFHSSEEVEIDVMRGSEEVSIVVQDLSTGYRMNAEDLYTNKSFKPPVHKEAVPINSWDLLKRQAGASPFADPTFRGAVISRVYAAMRKVENKIRRAIELQAAQVLQTGRLTLTDGAGNALYVIDYKPKASHFVTSGVAWGSAGATILADIESVAESIRSNGLANPDQLIMGTAAFDALISDEAVFKRFDARRIDLGTIAPMQMRGNGGTYRGRIDIGNYQYDIWTYAGKYQNPVTGALENYIDPGNVIVRASSGRLDATFGAIPNIGRLLNAQPLNLLPELPSRLSNIGGGMDLHTNVWLSNDGEQLFAGVGARPLLIPTALDTYGAITTGL